MQSTTTPTDLRDDVIDCVTGILDILAYEDEGQIITGTRPGVTVVGLLDGPEHVTLSMDGTPDVTLPTCASRAEIRIAADLLIG